MGWLCFTALFVVCVVCGVLLFSCCDFLWGVLGVLMYAGDCTPSVCFLCEVSLRVTCALRL